MEFAEYLPFWNKLTAEQKQRIENVIEFRQIKKDTHIHDSSADCLGLVAVRSGQLRAYILSEDGREITISRLTQYDVSLLSGNFSELMWLMEQIMWKSFDKRLAAFLLEEIQLEESDTLRMTHEKIANHMGTAREVVTRMLRYFQNEGMVQLTRGAIEITDRDKLEALAEA